MTPTISCKRASLSYVNLILNSYSISEYCSNLPGIIGPPRKTFCNFPLNMTKTDIINRMTILQNEITSLQNQLNSLISSDPEFESMAASITSQIIIKTHCLRKLKGKIIIFQKEDNELPSKRNEYALESDFIVKTMYVGALIESNFLNDATLFLNQMGAATRKNRILFLPKISI